ncbi:MAG: hypothetical protein IID34_14805 [Planctomycetes bacterium]|nr:hypothetical protein [Planctomycetota bacterium]
MSNSNEALCVPQVALLIEIVAHTGKSRRAGMPMPPAVAKTLRELHLWLPGCFCLPDIWFA